MLDLQPPFVGGPTRVEHGVGHRLVVDPCLVHTVCGPGEHGGGDLLGRLVQRNPRAEQHDGVSVCVSGDHRSVGQHGSVLYRWSARAVTKASSAAQTRATEMVVPWTVDRSSVGNDSCVQTLRMASKANARRSRPGSARAGAW